MNADALSGWLGVADWFNPLILHFRGDIAANIAVDVGRWLDVVGLAHAALPFTLAMAL